MKPKFAGTGSAILCTLLITGSLLHAQDAIEPQQAPDILANLTDGKTRVDRTRIFDIDVLEDPAYVPEFEAVSATFDPDAQSIVVTGTVLGRPAVKETRVFIDGETALVVTDIYLDAEAAAERRGRAMPVESLQSDGADGKARSATAPPPTVSSVGGVTSEAAGISNGRVKMTCGTRWNGSMVINDQGGVYRWTITGKNFGTRPGTVKVYDFAAPIVSWSDTRIVIDPTAPYTWAPRYSAATTIRTAAGTEVKAWMSVVPSVRTRIYEQCTWHVAMSRLNMGKQPSPTAYGSYSTITGAWAPQAGDQLRWETTHTAIIRSVGTPTTVNGRKTWRLTVSEYNSACTNDLNTYQTTFEVVTVAGRQSVAALPQSSVPKLRSATTYYR